MSEKPNVNEELASSFIIMIATLLASTAKRYSLPRDEKKPLLVQLETMIAQLARGYESAEEARAQLAIAVESRDSSARELDRMCAEVDAQKAQIEFLGRRIRQYHTEEQHYAQTVDEFSREKKQVDELRARDLALIEAGNRDLDAASERIADLETLLAHASAERTSLARENEALREALREKLPPSPVALREEGEEEGELLCEACGMEPCARYGEEYCDDCAREIEEEEAAAAAQSVDDSSRLVARIEEQREERNGDAISTISFEIVEPVGGGGAGILRTLDNGAAINLANMSSALHELRGAQLRRLAQHAYDTRWDDMTGARLLASSRSSLVRVEELCKSIDSPVVREEVKRRCADAANYLALALRKLS